MATYLLTWNPKLFAWTDLPGTSARVRKGRLVPDRWSCGVSQRLRKGDRLFILKQGREPRGIFGSGWATSDAFQDDHWNEDSTSTYGMYLNLKWDALLDPGSEPILSRDVLRTARLSEMHWNPRASGTQVLENAAAELERVWNGFLTAKFAIVPIKPQAGDRENFAGSQGAGFGVSENNAIVERAAVKIASKLYRLDGWNVESVERARCGFDLRCHKDPSVHEVEVKGITGEEEAFIITAGEVTQATYNPQFFICVVTKATSSDPAIGIYTGKEFLERFRLDPIQFRASLCK